MLKYDVDYIFNLLTKSDRDRQLSVNAVTSTIILPIFFTIKLPHNNEKIGRREQAIADFLQHKFAESTKFPP